MLLGVKCTISNLTPATTESLNKKEDSKSDSLISLGRGSRKGLLGELGVGVEEMEGALEGGGEEEDVEGRKGSEEGGEEKGRGKRRRRYRL